MSYCTSLTYELDCNLQIKNEFKGKEPPSITMTKPPFLFLMIVQFGCYQKLFPKDAPTKKNNR